ncbi:hypothetical protein Hanom_Chr05g00475981 [Helianthus anomalus]
MFDVFFYARFTIFCIVVQVIVSMFDVYCLICCFVMFVDSVLMLYCLCCDRI